MVLEWANALAIIITFFLDRCHRSDRQASERYPGHAGLRVQDAQGYVGYPFTCSTSLAMATWLLVAQVVNSYLVIGDDIAFTDNLFRAHPPPNARLEQVKHIRKAGVQGTLPLLYIYSEPTFTTTQVLTRRGSLLFGRYHPHQRFQHRALRWCRYIQRQGLPEEERRFFQS